MAKSPTWLRIAQIVLGVIAIALAGWVIANPGETTLLLIAFLGFALIMVGISKIIEGSVLRHIPKSSRIVHIVIGIISIAGGIFALANPLVAVLTLIMIVSIVILIHGLGLIITGIIHKNLSKGLRIANIILGVLAVIVSAAIHAMPGLAVAMVLILVSLGLFFHGIASIIAGIIGHKLSE